jgi:hypothetical protein
MRKSGQRPIFNKFFKNRLKKLITVKKNVDTYGNMFRKGKTS